MFRKNGPSVTADLFNVAQATTSHERARRRGALLLLKNKGVNPYIFTDAKHHYTRGGRLLLILQSDQLSDTYINFFKFRS